MKISYRNRSKSWYRGLGLAGVVILLASTILGCGPGYTDVDLDQSYNDGYAEGFIAGEVEGTANIETAKQESYDSGHEVGREAGYVEGYADGEEAAGSTPPPPPPPTSDKPWTNRPVSYLITQREALWWTFKWEFVVDNNRMSEKLYLVARLRFVDDEGNTLIESWKYDVIVDPSEYAVFQGTTLVDPFWGPRIKAIIAETSDRLSE